MKRYSKIIIFVLVLVVLVTGLVSVFLNTGGKSLVNIYKNYLTQDISDKKYSWDNFTDRGPREMLSGYYAGADSSGFYMWTFSGLKRFSHKQDLSVYYYTDVCGIIKEYESGNIKPTNGEEKSYVGEEMTYDMEAWKSKIKKGDYVWVLREGEGEDSKVIDKAWGSSNNSFPLDKITTQSCEY